ncbi:hypothetical protein HYE68_005359 [Fusarium pseudograminearum]|nr:hypothetical protein HYE68_005359 [Fusarium pseudograminearum]
MTDLNCNDLNATECLLRVTASILEQLKEDSSAFNWDPASFAVTLVIGIIAAAFAFLAIIQGFLAAGPGRHKCSKYAIGTWATLSKHKFDWSELRYRSIAQTPVIRIQNLLDKMAIPRDGASTRPEWNEDDFDHDRHFSKLQHVTKDMSDYFPATWLRLLTHTGLHHPELWETNPQGTDYLPSDLAAAPAYSTIADLIIVASITAGRIQFNSTGQDIANKASIQGEYLDLNFRSHPLLGVYAAIDQARPFGNDIFELSTMWNYNRPPAKKLLAKVAYSQGFLQSVRHFHVDWDLQLAPVDRVGWSAEMMKNLSRPLIRHIYESICDCKARSTSQGEAVRDHQEVMYEWCHAKKLRDFFHDSSLSDPLGIGEGDISILAAAAPLTRINIFPKRLANIGDKFIFLVILSRYCIKADISISENMIGGGEAETNDAPGLGSQSRPAFQVTEELKEYSYLYTTCLGRPELMRTDHNINDNIIREELAHIDSWIDSYRLNDLMVCRIKALAFTTAICKKMYQGTQGVRRWPTECDITREERVNIDETINSQGEITPNSLSSITKLVSLQVRKLRDYDQNRQSGTPSVNKYFTNSLKEKGRLRGRRYNQKPFRFLEYMEHITKIWEKDWDRLNWDRLKYPTEQVQHYLDDLLIYRATLIYILLSQAADNSHILSNPKCHKLIPVI